MASHNIIDYELKILLYGVWILVIYFDIKVILKFLEKWFQQCPVTSLVAEAQKGPKCLQMGNTTLYNTLLCLAFVI